MSKVENYKKITENFIIFSVLILVFFYDYFNTYLSFFDEFITLFFSFVIITALLFNQKVKVYKQEINITILLIFLSFIGLTSNYASAKLGYHTNKVAIIGDFISFNKAYISYFGIRFLVNNINSKRVINKLSIYAEIAFYILIIFLIVDAFFKIFPQYSRFGIKSFQLFFTHTSRYSFAFSFIFLLLFPKYLNKNKLFLIFVLFVGLLSLRVKYFGFFILALIFIYYGKELFKIPRKTFLIVIALLLIFVALIFKNQFQMYFTFDELETSWSRAIILFYSFKIGNDFFPLGTGFGTFSSHFSGKYYSWVYEMYGIDKVYGISRIYWEFVSDQFWPMVLGQFGYLGLLSFVGVIYNYFMLFLRRIKKSVNKSNYSYIPFLGLLLLLVDSSTDAIFTQNRAVAMFIIFGLFINYQRDSNGIDS